MLRQATTTVKASSHRDVLNSEQQSTSYTDFDLLLPTSRAGGKTRGEGGGVPVTEFERKYILRFLKKIIGLNYI